MLAPAAQHSPHTQNPHLPPVRLREASCPQVPLALPPTPSGAGDFPPFVLFYPAFQLPRGCGQRRREAGQPRSSGGPPPPPRAPSGQRGHAGLAHGSRRGVSGGQRGLRERGRGAGATAHGAWGTALEGAAHGRGEEGASGQEQELRGCHSRLPHVGPYGAEPRSPPANPPKPRQKLRAGGAGAAGSRRVPVGRGTCTGGSLLPCAADFVAGARRWGEWMMSRSKGAVSLFEGCV